MRPRLDGRTFRQTMGMFATGVTVIAVQTDQDVHAMTANAVTSVSLEPPLVLFCVGREARLAGHMERAQGFSINVLRDSQQVLSTYFAGGWRAEVPPPFRFVPFAGVPRLEGCLAALACRRVNVFPGGDHHIVVGEVTALHEGVEPHRPLIFYRGGYARLDESPREPAPDLGWASEPVHVFYDPWQADED